MSGKAAREQNPSPSIASRQGIEVGSLWISLMTTGNPLRIALPTTPSPCGDSSQRTVIWCGNWLSGGKCLSRVILPSGSVWPNQARRVPNVSTQVRTISPDSSCRSRLCPSFCALSKRAWRLFSWRRFSLNSLALAMASATLLARSCKNIWSLAVKGCPGLSRKTLSVPITLPCTRNGVISMLWTPRRSRYGRYSVSTVITGRINVWPVCIARLIGPSSALWGEIANKSITRAFASGFGWWSATVLSHCPSSERRLMKQASPVNSVIRRVTVFRTASYSIPASTSFCETSTSICETSARVLVREASRRILSSASLRSVMSNRDATLFFVPRISATVI